MASLRWAALAIPGAQKKDGRQRETEGQRNLKIANRRPLPDVGMQAPERRGEYADPAVRQPVSKQISGQDAADMQHRNDHARRVIVNAADQRLHIGELQRQKGRVIVNRVRDEAFEKIQPTLVAEYPERVIGGEGPEGGVNPAQADGNRDQPKD